jgi:hypothetical protein
MNGDGAPNARSVKDGEVKYESGAGGALKIRYTVTRERGWLEFSPANLHVEFNGKPVEFCQGIELTIDSDSLPKCKLAFTLTDVDIDMDTLIWLQAHVAAKQPTKAAEEGH